MAILLFPCVQAKMRSLSVEANKAASGPPQQRQQQQAHAHHQHGGQQQQQQHVRAEAGSAPAGAEGAARRAGSSIREGQPKAVPIVTAPRDTGSRRDAPGEHLRTIAGAPAACLEHTEFADM